MIDELSIGDVAAATGLSVHTLRFFEREHLLIRDIARDTAGRRRYTPDDVEWIRLCMRLRDSGMGIARLRSFTDLVRAGPGNETQRLALLREHQSDVRAKVADLNRCLDTINGKVAIYAEHVRAGTAGAVWSQPVDC
jgi:DNA-binding transcriptional MerR regulator